MKILIKLLASVLCVVFFVCVWGVRYDFYVPYVSYQADVFFETNISKEVIKAEFQLYNDKTPKTVQNFVRLAKQGKYQNVLVHRIEPGYLMQTGDYELANGLGGESVWGDFFEDEITKDLSHVVGTISMANLGKDANGSQFFWLFRDASALDGKHTVFGHVMTGLEALGDFSISEKRLMESLLITNIKVFPIVMGYKIRF